MTRRRVKYDGNHPDVVSTFIALGCSVTDTAGLGVTGFPDLVVGCCGVNHLVEVKNPETAYGRRGLAKQQTAYNAGWRGEPVELVTSLDDVEALVRTWRHDATSRRIVRTFPEEAHTWQP